MNLGIFNKQPVEVVDYDIDYSEWMTSADSLQSATVDVAPTGLVVESTFINSPRVKIWVSGGSSGTTYKLTVTATTKDGRIKQDEFKVKVKDI